MENDDLLEEETHTFVVKVWLEEFGEESGRVTWRGHITHVLSKRRRYIQTLEDVSSFIGPYLEEMGNKNNPPIEWAV